MRRPTRRPRPAGLAGSGHRVRSLSLPVHADPGPRSCWPRCRATSVVAGRGRPRLQFAPTFGRLLGDLAETGSTSTNLAPLRLDRPALTDPRMAHWFV